MGVGAMHGMLASCRRGRQAAGRRPPPAARRPCHRVRVDVAWDPVQYLRFADERARPLHELVARIPVDEARLVVDLGCGPGTETARLARRWAGAEVVGVDHDEAMIRQATALADPPRLRFELGDVRTFEGGAGADVVVSNATMHWVPGHLDLLGRWLSWLAPGGAFALQVPANFDAPSHRILREVAATARWRDRVAPALAAVDAQPPDAYYRRLRQLGAAVDLWKTTYRHVLGGPDPVVDWMRGSALRPYLARLDTAEQEAFVERYGALVREAYPPEPGGETCLDFCRLFVVARLSG